MLFEKNQKEKQLYFNELSNDNFDISLEEIYDFYMSGNDLSYFGLSKNGNNKIDYLKNDFKKRYKKDNYYDDFIIIKKMHCNKER